MKKSIRFLFLLLVVVGCLPLAAKAATQTANYGFNLPAPNSTVDEDIWGDLLNENWEDADILFQSVSDAIYTFQSIPIGTVNYFAGSSAPSEWLLSYGQAISRTTYASLFSVVGTTYGSGDGSTTFNLPDCRGRVIAGKDDMGGSSANRLTGVSGSVNGDTLGGTGGAETHTLTTAEIPNLNVGISAQWALTGLDPTPDYLFAAGGSTTVNSGGGGAHNNVQPTLILNCIIFAGQ